jgi:hypothetical protein
MELELELISKSELKLMKLNNIKQILEYNCVRIPKNIEKNLLFELNNITDRKLNVHISFLVDHKSKNIISHGFNFYFKTKKYPFSIHAEINTINKFYKKNTDNYLKKTKKILFIFKISKTGVLGLSKPCRGCANFLSNNYDNLNLSKIYYSVLNENMIELTKEDLLNLENFEYSTGISNKNIKY